MKSVCAWCQEVVREGEGPITHAICQSCASDKQIREASSIDNFIEKFPFPVLALNSSLETVGVNTPAAAQFGVAPEKVAGCRPGVVVECEMAVMPERCGKGIHCVGCTLRNSIYETHETGKPLVAVPATFSTTAQGASYLISTIKVGDCVVVRLEPNSNSE